MEFRFGVDFGFGGAVSLDGEIAKSNYGNLWWGASNMNSATHLSIKPTRLEAGTHKMYVAGGEGCCDGDQTFQYKVGAHGDWRIFNANNLGK